MSIINDKISTTKVSVRSITLIRSLTMALEKSRILNNLLRTQELSFPTSQELSYFFLFEGISLMIQLLYGKNQSKVLKGAT